MPLPRLTAKPHPFSGAALTPKHARELTPALVLTISSALASSALAANSALHSAAAAHKKSTTHPHFRRQTSSSDYDSDPTLTGVQYTVWITEAWRILGWAEPSAALFWEMATMYHTLHVASRSLSDEIRNGNNATSLSAIPPILSCGSASSIGSNPAVAADRSSPVSNIITTPLSPGGGSGSNSSNNASQIFVPSSSAAAPASTTTQKGNRKNAGIVAKELPVWLVGMFLLLHCEEQAFMRNVSGEDERRFDAIRNRRRGSGGGGGDILQPLTAAGRGEGGVIKLLLHPSLSPRTRIHAGQHTDNVHLSVFILRHLRKFLLLCALPHNSDALSAMSTLSRTLPNSTPHSSPPSNPSSSSHYSPSRPNSVQILFKHDHDHGNVGNKINLSLEDLERLSFVLHAPNGGLIEEPPVRIGEYFYDLDSGTTSSSTSPPDHVRLSEAERILRQQLEYDLEFRDDDTPPSSPEEKIDIADSLQNLSVSSSSDDKPRITPSGYQKELIYTNLHGRTTILKPSGGGSSASVDADDRASNAGSIISTASGGGVGPLNGRLHDLTVRDCSDAHMYLLQPFENATISACTGCTIVVGAVAGLLHVVDCERTTITSAARRLLICNSFEVLNCCFTPSPPLQVGDNRSCQFAPYNTYYDGLREDLLATGLAAAVLDHAPPHHPSLFPDAASPALQCASNKWKQPVELSKLEIPQVINNPQGGGKPETTGGDAVVVSPRDATSSNELNQRDDTMLTPVLQPSTEFHVLFVPFESEAANLRRQHQAALSGSNNNNNFEHNERGGMKESQYCLNLADVLQLSPFRLPVEYERRVLVKAERMRSLQQAMNTDLTMDQRLRVEEELNKEFRDWLVTSGNLRQVLDLVHMEKEEMQ